MMPWHCPACSTIISHSEQVIPSAGRRYRCHVCRVTLEFDPMKGRMLIADAEADHQIASEDDKARRRLAVLIHDRRKAPRRSARRK